MTDKETIINKVNVNRCSVYKNGLCLISKEKCNAKCDYAAYYLYEQLERKEQEYEELRQYHNKCCKEFENEKQALLEKYNQVSINFYNGDYCNTEHCSLLKAKEQECGELKRKVELMMDCPDCKVDEYKKALEKIEKVINNILNSCLGRNTVSCRPAHNVCGDLINILDIIKKIKESE